MRFSAINPNKRKAEASEHEDDCISRKKIKVKKAKENVSKVKDKRENSSAKRKKLKSKKKTIAEPDTSISSTTEWTILEDPTSLEGKSRKPKKSGKQKKNKSEETLPSNCMFL